MKTPITASNAPKAIGNYSPAIKSGHTVYLSGQIALDPSTMTLVAEDVAEQAKQVFENLAAVAEAAGGSCNDIVRLTIYLTDMATFSEVNDVMAAYFKPPYPARTTIGVAALPKDAAVEVDAIMVLSS